MNYQGEVIFNNNFPDGVKKRKIDCSKIKKLGWRPKIKFNEGLENYCKYYLERIMPIEY